MRVTQGMLAQQSLRHVTQNYKNLSEMQNQLSTGKKISRPSQDPVVAVNGMRYRAQVAEVEQFQRNVQEAHTWMDAGDTALGEATQVLQRLKELTTQAANDTYEASERGNIAKEVKQLKEHMATMANTSINGKYIFNGTDTNNAPVDSARLGMAADDMFTMDAEELESLSVNIDGAVYSNAARLDDDTIQFTNDADEIVTFTRTDDGMELNVNGTAAEPDAAFVYDESALSMNQDRVNIELLHDTMMPVNISPDSVFNQELFADLERLERTLSNPDAGSSDIEGFLSKIDTHMNNTVNERAELGARTNRIEMMENRLGNQELIAEKVMSKNEDVDLEKTIIELMLLENVHQASLSAGARIIQPSLMDFLR
ncbi:flagellar hook-associated protein FlgL [Sinobaca sp. H24]|uniref:flagellar hook-associated protein FlgL n=1 Tax=Sinobaca sp. H24 TaxID=2923376 RepID=UPI00207AECCA|nr:flagellar hook-associated protein FlgL [Sinobaca sp. H24]